MRLRAYRASQGSGKLSPYDGAYEYGGDCCIDVPDLDALVRFTERDNHARVIGDGPEIWIYHAYME